MAKVILHPMIKQISGKLGNMVFRTSHTGEITLAKRPDMSRVKWSKAQKEQRQRFKQAVTYAKAAMAEPKVRKVYEKMAAKKNKRPSPALAPGASVDMAVSDYFKGNDLLSKK